MDLSAAFWTRKVEFDLPLVVGSIVGNGEYLDALEFPVLLRCESVVEHTRQLLDAPRKGSRSDVYNSNSVLSVGNCRGKSRCPWH